MQVTMRANCWNGTREKVLDSGIKVEGLPVFIQETPGRKWWQDKKLKAIIGIGVPLLILSHAVPGAFVPVIIGGRVMAAALSPQSVANAPELGDAIPAMGGVSASVHSKILHAFDPLVNLIQDLAYPIAAVMIAAGSIMIMIGNKEKGMQYLTNAALGYILVQLVPLMLSLLVGVGSSV